MEMATEEIQFFLQFYSFEYEFPLLIFTLVRLITMDLSIQIILQWQDYI